LGEAWASADELSEGDLVALIDGLADELPADSAVGDFERAGARDSTGLGSYSKALLDAS
jgi:hypothetical protein